MRFEKVEKFTDKTVTIKMSANNLPGGGFLCFLSSSNPFFRIYRKREKDELMIYESEVQYDS